SHEKSMKKIILIFIISFFLNFIWENLHSLLYANYMGRPITEFILLHATLGDVVMIMIISLPFLFLPFFKKYDWLIIPIGIIISISIEWYALGVGRWSYNEFMPIIPLLGVGLTPVLQLGFLGYVSLKISDIINS
ncbi:MAG: hypothetical protein Q7S72_01940, partial [Candidatus Taylorbacteria bacterium]|nr:hypothetical protein [Candidatus Taylorbacteria bacterium]